MLDMGVERAIGHCQHVAYVEIEAFAAFNLVAQMEKGLVAPTPIWSNLKTFPARPFRGLVDGITGGYPCQPFSHAGQRRGTDDPRHLWPYIESIVDTIRPLWCFFENVEGHLSLGFDEVFRSLENLGYTVEAGIYSAAELGASQVRERLFILAITDPRGLWECVADANGQRGRFLSSKPRQCSGEVAARQGGKALGNANLFRRNGNCAALPTDKGNSSKDRRRMYQPTGANILPGNDRQPQSGNPENVADTRSQRSGQNRANTITKQLNTDALKWPAGPGHPQHEWESPRAIESGMGCTVDGYNFRRDLLRMLGNGVVHPVATHAFLDLFGKQCKNFGLPPIQSNNPSILPL